MNKIRLFMMAMVALVFAACQESNGDYRDVVYITGTCRRIPYARALRAPTR